MDVHSFAFGSILVFVEHYSSEATGRCKETSDLAIFGHHEIRKIVRSDVVREEISPSPGSSRLPCCPGPNRLSVGVGSLDRAATAPHNTSVRACME